MSNLETAAAPLYLDTSVALRATLEQGTTPEVEQSIATAPLLVTSRLSLVESARALLRIRTQRSVPEPRLADARRELDALWNRCELSELSRGVCDLAAHLAPDQPLRTLDALHQATFLLARAHRGASAAHCRPTARRGCTFGVARTGAWPAAAGALAP